MHPVDPCVPTQYLPTESRAVVIAKNGKTVEGGDVDPLPSIRTPDGKVITRWTLSDDERSRILKGEDVYLTIWSHGSIHPVALSVGICNWR